MREAERRRRRESLSGNAIRFLDHIASKPGVTFVELAKPYCNAVTESSSFGGDETSVAIGELLHHGMIRAVSEGGRANTKYFLS